MVTLQDLQQMVIFESCISEALRLSTGSLIMREAVEPCTLTLADGTTFNIRKGDNVGIFPPIVHRDERFFPNAETFQYDRFLKMKETIEVDGAEVSSSQCFIPFGGGISYCPGRKFARNEIKTLAIHLLLKFKMSLNGSSLAKQVTVDYSRAGLGIFQPKDCTLQLNLTPIR
jgi:cytochrome P450